MKTCSSCYPRGRRWGPWWRWWEIRQWRRRSRWGESSTTGGPSPAECPTPAAPRCWRWCESNRYAPTCTTRTSRLPTSCAGWRSGARSGMGARQDRLWPRSLITRWRAKWRPRSERGWLEAGTAGVACSCTRLGKPGREIKINFILRIKWASFLGI